MKYNLHMDEYKEYMYVPLNEPLERGQTYKFQMYVRLLNASTVTIKQLGVYFSEFVYDKNMTFNKENQIDTSYSKGLSGTLDWIPIKGEYIAKGGEKYIIIGNFISIFKVELYVYIYLDFKL